jgi:hypothetical protein
MNKNYNTILNENIKMMNKTVSMKCIYQDPTQDKPPLGLSQYLPLKSFTGKFE